jgi:hypothetical protein
MNDEISLKEALTIIEAKDQEGFPIPFKISFRTLQRNSKTGGRLTTYLGATILTSVPKQRKSNKAILEDLQKPERAIKKPNHSTNRTRNIQKANGEIAKIHIRLIDSINNKKVVY